MNRRLLAIVATVLTVGTAFVLYQPILRIGLLSDDYALLMWARRLELLPRDWGQIRPVPIVAWWLLARLTGPASTPVAIHALNVTLHGLNAMLVGVIGARLLDIRRFSEGRTAGPASDPPTTVVGPRFGRATVAAALFVAMPIAVEPVAWASSVFDVMLATFALTLGVVATRRPQLTPADQGVCLLLAIAMLATKETGVIAGLLLLLIYWTRWNRLDRSALAVAAAQLLLVGTYGLTRKLTGRLDDRLTPRFDFESIGRLFSGVSRAFVMPLHRDVVIAHPAVAASCAVLIVLVLTAWIVRCRRSPQAMRVAVLALVGTLVCVAPAIRIFGVTSDLQGTRYVYLASAWWSIALAAALLDGWRTPRARLIGWAVAGLVVSAAAAATRVHLQPWVAARAERDRVLQRLVAVPASCRQVAATAATDNVAGAYVFRNGLNEALATLGRSFEWVSADQAAPECRVNLER